MQYQVSIPTWGFWEGWGGECELRLLLRVGERWGDVGNLPWETFVSPF